AFVVRSETSLRKMADVLAGLRERYERVFVQDTGKTFNTELTEVIELGFMLDCADALVAAALARDESRGGHYREDHPLRDDANWLKHSLAYSKADGSIKLETKPVKLGPYIPMERKY
ncbi:MAG: succinate dehydrogenase/fumarate reductase flavoprotein subunit, partial [Actinomycetota bacterium]